MSVPGSSLATRIFWDPLVAAVFPSQCPSCARLLDAPSCGPLCLACWETLPRHRPDPCGCGTPLATREGPCGRCRRNLSPFEAGASLGPFEGSLRSALHALKYKGHRRAARLLAAALASEPSVQRLLVDGAVLVPVPLHPLRRRERGFNQAELLARELARRATGVLVAPEVLVRRRDTPSQTGLTAAQRRRNVRGAFAIRHRSRVTGQKLILVDDVLTTGATVRECARALRSAGAREVQVLTAARAL